MNKYRVYTSYTHEGQSFEQSFEVPAFGPDAARMIVIAAINRLFCRASEINVEVVS